MISAVPDAAKFKAESDRRNFLPRYSRFGHLMLLHCLPTGVPLDAVSMGALRPDYVAGYFARQRGLCGTIRNKCHNRPRARSEEGTNLLMEIENIDGRCRVSRIHKETFLGLRASEGTLKQSDPDDSYGAASGST